MGRREGLNSPPELRLFHQQGRMSAGRGRWGKEIGGMFKLSKERMAVMEGNEVGEAIEVGGRGREEDPNAEKQAGEEAKSGRRRSKKQKGRRRSNLSTAKKMKEGFREQDPSPRAPLSVSLSLWLARFLASRCRISFHHSLSRCCFAFSRANLNDWVRHRGV